MKSLWCSIVGRVGRCLCWFWYTRSHSSWFTSRKGIWWFNGRQVWFAGLVLLRLSHRPTWISCQLESFGMFTKSWTNLEANEEDGSNPFYEFFKATQLFGCGISRCVLLHTLWFPPHTLVRTHQNGFPTILTNALGTTSPQLSPSTEQPTSPLSSTPQSKVSKSKQSVWVVM